MRKIKIVRVIARLNIGGPAIHVLNLTAKLDSNLFETILITGCIGPNEGDMTYLAEALGVRPILVSELQREISPLDDVRAVITLWRIFRRERPDIVHTHTAKAGTIGRIAALLARVPIIVHTFHGHVFHSYFPLRKTRFFVLIERLLALFSTYIVAISPRQKEEIGAYLKSKERIVVIPLGFDLSRFVTANNKDQARERLNLPKDKKIVGIVGRLAPVKNHKLFIWLAEESRKEDEDILFVIVGDGEERPRLERMVRERRLSDRVTFLGWQKDIEIVYKAIDLLVLTSVNEGTPVAVIEAMASGCPVLASCVGGVPDLIEHNKNGLLANPSDRRDFLEKMTYLLGDCQTRKDLARKGQEFVLKRYDLNRLLMDMTHLYLQNSSKKLRVKSEK